MSEKRGIAEGEATVLRAGYAYQAATEWHLRVPPDQPSSLCVTEGPDRWAPTR